MPAKLYVVIVLLAANVIVNLIERSFLSAILGVLLIAFIVKASHTARTIGIWISVAGLALLAYTVIDLGRMLGFGNFTALIWLIIALGVISSGFTIWALTRSDVVEWFDSAHGAGTARNDNEPPRYV